MNKITFNKLLIALLFIAVPIFILSSCRRNSIDVELFEASLEIATPNVHDGDDFSFKIHATKFPFVVTSFSCEFDDGKVVPLDTEIDKTEGDYALFTFKEVSVDKTRKSTLSIIVKDPSTGKQHNLSATYRTYQNTDISVEIELPAAVGTKITDKSVPAVIEGEGVPILIKSKMQKVKILEVDCEFNTGGLLVEGKEIVFDKNGEWRCTLPEAVFDEEITAYHSSLSILFQSPEGTGQEIIETEPAEYIKVKAPKATFTIDTPEVMNTGTFSCSLSLSRETIKVTKISSSYPALNQSANEGLPSEIFEEIGMDGRINFDNGKPLTFTKEDIESEKDATYYITFTLNDYAYSGKELSVTGSFKVLTYHAATSIDIVLTDPSVRMMDDCLVLDIDNFHANESGSTETPNEAVINIVSDDPLANGEYDFEVVKGSGEGSVTCKKLKSESNNSVFYTVTSKKEGATTLRFFPVGNKNVAKTLKIFVRKRVALVLDGEFACVSKSGYSYGWVGMPKETWAELMYYQSKTGDKSIDLAAIDNDSIEENAEFYSINDNSIRYSFTLVLRTNKITSSVFYESCNISGEDPCVVLANYIDQKKKKTQPQSLTRPLLQETSFSFVSSGAKTSLTPFTNTMYNLNCCATAFYGNSPNPIYERYMYHKEGKTYNKDFYYFGRYTYNYEYYDQYIDVGKFDSINILLKDIEYDKKEYDLRYYCLLFVSREKSGKLNNAWWTYPCSLVMSEGENDEAKYLTLPSWARKVSD